MDCTCRAFERVKEGKEFLNTDVVRQMARDRGGVTVGAGATRNEVSPAIKMIGSGTTMMNCWARDLNKR